MSVKTVSIADGLVLTSRDVLTATGALRGIEYELEVKKDKVVVFEIDFAGSTNLALAGAGGLKRTTTVKPFSKQRVALVEVRDPDAGWALETRYTWVEENPNAVLPGASKREALSEGVFIVTTRSDRSSPTAPDQYTYEAVVEKNATVKITLDFSECTNIELVGGKAPVGVLSTTPPKTATVVVQPFSRARIGVLAAKNPAKGYSLRTKWSWTETPGAVPSPQFDDAAWASNGGGGADAPPTRYRDDADFVAAPAPGSGRPRMGLVQTPPRAQYLHTDDDDVVGAYGKRSSNPAVGAAAAAPFGGYRLPLVPLSQQQQQQPQPPTQKPLGLSARANANANASKATSPGSLTKRSEEISPHVVLTTETIEGTWERPTEVVYRLSVGKNTRVVFTADFTGSANLVVVAPVATVVASKPMSVTSSVDPFAAAEVARLRCVDPSLGWKLVCKYAWSEEDVDLDAEEVSPPPPPPPPPTMPPPMMPPPQPNTTPTATALTTRYASLRELLQSLGLEAYVSTFEREELTLELLRVMSRDEAEFRHSLQQLGISKMGHREKILLAVKASV